MGADFEVDLRTGGAMTWSGPGKDGRPTRYVTGEVLAAEAPTRLEYKFGMGDGAVMSRVKIALTQETEAVKVVVTNDGFADEDPAYLQNAEGWPRILSRLKTLLETGKTFRPPLSAPTGRRLKNQNLFPDNKPMTPVFLVFRLPLSASTTF